MQPIKLLSKAHLLVLLVAGCGENPTQATPQKNSSLHQQRAIGGEENYSSKLELNQPTVVIASEIDGFEKFKDDCATLRHLAATNLPSAIKFYFSLRDSGISQEILDSVFAPSIYDGTFGFPCPFTQNHLDSLELILNSDLPQSSKSHILKLCSAGTAGKIDAGLKLMTIAEKHNADEKTIATIVQAIARLDPVKAVDKFGSLPWKPEYGIATSRLYAEFIMKDPLQGSKAVADLEKTSEQYQWAVAGLYQAIRAIDPDSAAKWRMEITNQNAARFADSLSYSLREN